MTFFLVFLREKCVNYTMILETDASDRCADVDSQSDFLPRIGCLNYLTTIGHIVKNLPYSLHSNRIVQYAENYDNAYPSFKDFAAMVQE